MPKSPSAESWTHCWRESQISQISMSRLQHVLPTQSDDRIIYAEEHFVIKECSFPLSFSVA